MGVATHTRESNVLKNCTVSQLDFRNQRFERDTRKMRKAPFTLQGSEETPRSKNAENAENADTKTRTMRKMRLTGFHVSGFR